MKTIKTYKSPCLMIINVTVGDKNRQINFDPCAIGGSSYTTDSENLQKAIECHSLFGSRIFLGGVEKIEENKSNGATSRTEQEIATARPVAPHIEKEAEDAGATEAEEQDDTVEVQEEKEQSEGPEKVEVTDIDEAKEYLKSRFKAKASQVKTTSMVLEYAHEHGVEFVGL